MRMIKIFLAFVLTGSFLKYNIITNPYMNIELIVNTMFMIYKTKYGLKIVVINYLGPNAIVIIGQPHIDTRTHFQGFFSRKSYFVWCSFYFCKAQSVS